MLFSTTMLVITLPPPDFPFPLEEIDNLILKQFFPIETPWKGLSFRESERTRISDFNEGYFLKSFLNCFRKEETGFIL